MTIQFDRGTVWQRDLGEPDVSTVDRSKGQKPIKRRVAPTPAPVPAARTAVARTIYDGNWSVVIITQSGNCDRHYRYGVQISNGNIISEGGANFQGRISPNGSVWVSVSAGGQQAGGQGSLNRNLGHHFSIWGPQLGPQARAATPERAWQAHGRVLICRFSRRRRRKSRASLLTSYRARRAVLGRGWNVGRPCWRRPRPSVSIVYDGGEQG